MAFLRSGDLQVIATYNQDTIQQLATEWRDVKTKQFCRTGECPFALKQEASFDWEASKFLYYRARAITAGIANGNGDLFPDIELDPATPTFVGKGVYYNHDSDDPLKAFGMILDAAWSPHYRPDFKDKYIEILGAIDKELIEQKRPGLLRQIEAGILLSTSMGCIAEKAQCSVCGNMATSVPELCVHMHPKSALYCKGKKDFTGKIAYETNYGITFTEDSFVPQPADATAHVFEIFAAQKNGDGTQFDRLASHFKNYWIAKKGEQNLPKTPLQTTESDLFRQAAPATFPGAFPSPSTNKEKAAPLKTLPPLPEEKGKGGRPSSKVPATPEETIPDLQELPEDARKETHKLLEHKLQQLIADEVRKQLGPSILNLVRKWQPEVQQQVKTVTDAVKGQVGGGGEAAKEVNVQETPTPPQGTVEAVKTANLIILTEDFSNWAPEDKRKLIGAVVNGEKYTFDGLVGE